MKVILLFDKKTEYLITLKQLISLYRKGELENKEREIFGYAFRDKQTEPRHFITYTQLEIWSKFGDDMNKKYNKILWNKA